MFNRSPKPENDSSRSFKERDEKECDSPPQNVRAVNKREIGVKLVMEVDKDNLVSQGQDPRVKFEESPERSDEESPGKTGVRDTVKGILKSTGHSARGMMHALSRKGSNKSRDSDSNGEFGPILSPGCGPEGELSSDGPDQAASPTGQMGSSPLSSTGQMGSSPLSPTVQLRSSPLSPTGQMESNPLTPTGQMGSSPLSPTGQVNAGEPDMLMMDTVDVNGTNKGDEEMPPEPQVISSSLN
ncbi:unnamed protein product [Lactuca virosa]|uniref:Uncharacterized protein n=1 Tax=Lactuca virosa TaxID=75947 RepID=A0AAU9MD41_9ASTR|nr:unnamed protein product [Lactuca virosa]